MPGPATEVLEIVTAIAGDDLRTIAIYGPDTYVFAYQRDDIRDRYLPADIDFIHEALVGEGMGRDYLEELFNAGALQSSTHVFEEGTMMHFLAGDQRGLFVSIDADADVSILDLSARCEAWLYEQDFEALLEDA